MTQKPSFAPHSANFDKQEKKPFESIVYTNEAISLVAMRSKIILIGPRKSRHCQTWLERCYSWNENLQWKQKCTAKSKSLEENAGKIETIFVIRAALNSLDVALDIAGVEKVS